MMFESYGTKRVMEPRYVLPTSAWRLDNSREIKPNELRMSIRKLHVETTSFKQICLEANNNPRRIREKMMDIVIRRGKFHNPVTDTGGVVYGVVEEIGPEYRNKKNLKIGDEIICNSSLAAVPLYISRITNIDMAYHQVDVEGYAILFEDFPVIKKEPDVCVELLLYILDESGTLYMASEAARGKQQLLVVGNDLLKNLIFGYVMRRAAGPEARIVCFLDERSDIMFKGKSVDDLMKAVFTEVHQVNTLKPMECLSRLEVNGLFDLSVNCAAIPDAETLNILATRQGGTVVFANLLNNHNIALYITETIARQMEIRCATGYMEEYDEFDIQIVRELEYHMKKAQRAERKVRDGWAPEQTGQRRRLVEDFICESRTMTVVLNEALSVAKYDCNVLISGDTGVGKEKVASLIQKNSNRRMQPFIKINCASIAPHLIESELFGYEKGSFTGANVSGKKGYFELADNGIILLDEIGELPQDVQAKLLRVIQEGEFYRVGGTTPVRANVRIISATNRNLEELVNSGRFRRDLYYRLNVFPIQVPSLDERRADIPALAAHFVEKYNKKFGMERVMDEEALEYLMRRDWPGNIRELENVTQRLLIACKSENITVYDIMRELNADLFEGTGEKGSGMSEKVGGAMREGGNKEELHGADEDPFDEAMDLERLVETFEKNIIRRACEKYGSSRKVAKALGISQTQAVRKINKYGLSKQREEE